MWEKFTTKPLVDSGEWRRVGECVTPWPCFVVAATNTALEKFGPDLLEVLEVVRREAEDLESSPHAAETVGTMHGLALTPKPNPNPNPNPNPGGHHVRPRGR